MRKVSYTPEMDKEEFENMQKRTKKGLKILAVSVGVAGTAYILGGLKGYKLGFNLGRKSGKLTGYEEAMNDMRKLVKEAKEKVDK